MNLSQAIGLLAAHAEALARLCADVSAEEARARPAPESWSILEVLCHLLDEEREDFRQRIDLTLHHPGREWPPIDPEAWVTARGYQERDLAETVAAFAAERRASLAWLQSLSEPDWGRGRSYPNGFVLHAGDLLAAWVAHDLLHLRQLVELRYHLVTLAAAPYVPAYAGDW